MKSRIMTPGGLRNSVLLTLTVALLAGCNGEVDRSNEQSLRAGTEIKLDSVVSNQLAPLTLDDASYLLLASETRGLVLLRENGEEQLALDGGKVERFALQAQSDGSWLVASFDEGRSEIVLHRLSVDAAGAPLLDLIGTRAMAAPQVALCFAEQAMRSHLFAIDENGLGHEYVLNPAAGHWQFREVRPLYFGEQVSSCAVDDRRGRLLVAQPPLGLWSLNSNAERDEEREVFVAASDLGDEFGGLWIDGSEDRVWLTSGGQVHAYDLDTARAPAVFARKLQGLEPISAARRGSDLFALAEESDSVAQYTVTLPQAQPTATAVREIPLVAAHAETDPVASAGDAADDPAIWIHPQDAAASLILGTDKKHGLNVYGLNGELRQQFAVGRVNNVDLRPVDLPGINAIAAASNRSTPGINLFAISDSGVVESLGLLPLDMPDPYGLCMYRRDHRDFVWVTDKKGGLQLLEIVLDDNGRDWQLRPRANLKVASQVEGCVADDERHTLFFGEEDRGIWRLDISAFLAGEGKPQLVAEVDGENLVDDVEGMGLYHDGDSGYLVVSSQGNNSYALYSRDGSRFVGHFRVDGNPGLGVDGSSETDGLEVTSAPLGAAYSQGLLVVQDGRNRMPAETQNFKLVAWADIAERFRLP
ncbi:phytase [Microbulbifer hainanensis]|uniref:phytase n=1 Tax=Microbulbifer hainanensis TaxID=2735675 RepID=UPI001866A660|nr:phytase [Microbulbifer hainanensis]